MPRRPGIGAQRPLPHSQTIVLDGLLGLGAKPPLREPIRAACQEINALREGALVFAVDLPTGLDGDSGEADADCVVGRFYDHGGLRRKPDWSRTRRLILSAAWKSCRCENCSRSQGGAEVAIPETLRALLPRRSYSAYKNQFGRIGIVAGSRGFTGAAVLCSLGALRAGAGLVELFVPEEIYEIVAAAAAPEVMVKPVKSYADLLQEQIDVWAIGPGLGKAHAEEILTLICDAKEPMVVDADGLNILVGEYLGLAEDARSAPPHSPSRAR